MSRAFWRERQFDFHLSCSSMRFQLHTHNLVTAGRKQPRVTSLVTLHSRGTVQRRCRRPRSVNVDPNPNEDADSADRRVKDGTAGQGVKKPSRELFLSPGVMQNNDKKRLQLCEVR